MAQRNGKKQRNINSKRVSSGGNQLDVSNIASNKNNLSHTNSVAKNTLGVATTLKTNVVVGRHSFTLGDTLHFVRKATDAIYAKSLSLPVVLKSPGNPQLSKGKKNAICPGEESMIEIYEESDYPENVHVEHSESEYPSSVKILTRVEEGRSFNKEIYPLEAMSRQSHSSDSGENAERKLKMTRDYSSARDLC